MKKVVVFIIIALIFSLGYYYFKPQNDIHISLAEDSHMHNVIIRHVTSSTTDWEAKIRSVIIDYRTDSADIFDLDFFFPQQGLRTSSESGVYEMKTDNLYLQGKVVSRTDSMTLTTDALAWVASEQKSLSDSPVVIHGNSFTVRGTGLEIIKDGTLTIRENVRAVIEQGSL